MPDTESVAKRTTTIKNPKNDVFDVHKGVLIDVHFDFGVLGPRHLMYFSDILINLDLGSSHSRAGLF